LGRPFDVILYDGTLSVGMRSHLHGRTALHRRSTLTFKTTPMTEILVEDRFDRAKTVVAATGIKVSAPGLEGAIAGSPLIVIRGDPGRSGIG